MTKFKAIIIPYSSFLLYPFNGIQSSCSLLLFLSLPPPASLSSLNGLALYSVLAMMDSLTAKSIQSTNQLILQTQPSGMGTVLSQDRLPRSHHLLVYFFTEEHTIILQSLGSYSQLCLSEGSAVFVAKIYGRWIANVKVVEIFWSVFNGMM